MLGALVAAAFGAVIMRLIDYFLGKVSYKEDMKGLKNATMNSTKNLRTKLKNNSQPSKPLGIN